MLLEAPSCATWSASHTVEVQHPARVTDASLDVAIRVEPTDSYRTESIDAAPRGSELSQEEKDALVRCAMSQVSFSLGHMGAITARIEMNGQALPRIRTESDIDREFRSAVPGDACDHAAKVLAVHLPCTWEMRGPFPSWTIKTVSPT